ncbi:cobalamin B12-binding domain-containing protein [Marinilabilia rubra]|uniref:Cobalamin-binding protein n=1 Tax=Marinilabilia rubra TaxID=2162893 RepID=A0A2U2B6E5_9BACT|nr:B12-binding domain-containing protein [Marinilabilia rubra]PWD98613.1 cobalamin-binding protein [Marinilabilia rubra]
MNQETEKQALLRALLKGSRENASQVIKQFIDQDHTIIDLYEYLIKETMYEIGYLWETGKISVATEHLASAIVENLMNEIYHLIATPEKKEDLAVICSIENEQHQIGSKMVSDVYEMNNWNTRYLGANTPKNDLIHFVKSINPKMLALSMSLFFHLPELESTLQTIKKELPGLLIIIGGQGLKHGSQDFLKNYQNVFYKPDLFSLDSFLKTQNQHD